MTPATSAPEDNNRRFTDFLHVLRRSTNLLTEDPVREDLFSVERLEQYAMHLAGELKTTTTPERGKALVPGLKSIGKKLLDAYQILALAIKSNHTVSPAAEWFVDNFHIVEDQLREIRHDLPASYYYELPKLAEGELAGYPRVYAIALAIIAHSDSRLDTETLRRFILAFQQSSPF